MNKRSKRMKQMWNSVTADMMTEEEMGTENNYIRHRQSWRSTRFNSFMETLDEERCTKTLARQRDTGDIVVRPPPPRVKPWMVATEERDDEGELFSSLNGL